MKRHALSSTMWILAGLLLSAPVVRAQAAVDAVLRDFQRVGDYLLEVDGEAVPKAEIYRSERAATLLIRSSHFPSPVVLSPRSGAVETVHIMGLLVRGDGSIDVAADAEVTPRGRFRVENGQDVHFELDGHEVVIKPKPPLVGLQDAAGLKEHNASYGRLAADYTPDAATLRALRARGDAVRVRVYFGSWCPFCARYVPRMIKVDEELAGSKIAIEYYGLPHPPFDDEPAAKRDKVSGVPTGIVYVGGREVGRIEGQEWTKPEIALADLLK